MQLHSPWILSLLLLIPLVIVLMWWRRSRSSLRISTIRNVHDIQPSLRQRFRFIKNLIRIACIALVIIALARPREGITSSTYHTKGVVMQLVVDRSGSMEHNMTYNDQAMSRLDVVKEVLKDFVKGSNDLSGRQSDMLGLITFARYADTHCPLIRAHDALLGFLDRIECVTERSEDGTAIGDALALAAARLKKAEDEITQRNTQLKAALESNTVVDPDSATESKPEFEIHSKIILLLTDGDNNAGEYLPQKAAELAREWGIKIYTIGVGGPSQIRGLLGPMRFDDLNERLLAYIANQTNGKYARATDGESLKKIISAIDELEKTEIESIEYSRYEERFLPWALAALIALGLEILTGCTIFRKIP